MNRTSHSVSWSTLLAGAALLALPAAAQDAASWQSADVEVTGHVLEPQQLEPTEERIGGLELPDGLRDRGVRRAT